MPGTATCIGPAQRRVAAFTKEAGSDLLDRYEIILADAVEAGLEAFNFFLVKLRGLVNNDPLGRLVAVELFVPFDDQAHQGFRGVARQMRRFLLVPVERVAPHDKGLAIA